MARFVLLPALQHHLMALPSISDATYALALLIKDARTPGITTRPSIWPRRLLAREDRQGSACWRTFASA